MNGPIFVPASTNGASVNAVLLYIHTTGWTKTAWFSVSKLVKGFTLLLVKASCTSPVYFTSSFIYTGFLIFSF